MAIYNPATMSWIPDSPNQVNPFLSNPALNNGGYNMPGVDMNLINQINGYSNIVNPGGSTNPGGPMPNDPFTFQGAGGGPPNSTAGNDAFNNVFNRGTTPRTSNNPPVIGSPQLATNMGMTGAENVGGVGMYTGANGPLDLTRFTPVQNTPPPGAPPGSIPTGDPNTWITPWGATYTTPGSINNQTSADYDAYRQRAFGNIMGPQGAGPQSNPYSELTDALRQAPGSINAQTFNGYLNSLNQPQTPQSSPDPYGDSVSSMRQQEQVRQAMRSLGISEYGPALTPQQIQQLTQRLGYNPVTQPGGNSQLPGQPGQSPVIGSPGMMGPRPYTLNPGYNNYDPARQRMDMMNMEWAQNPNWYPGATGINGMPLPQYLPVGYRNGYDPNSTPSGGYGPEFQTPTQSAISMGPGAAAFAPGGIYGGQGGGDPYRTGGLDPGPRGNLPSANPINWEAMGNSRDPNSAYQQYARQVESLADPNHPAGRSDYVYNPQTGGWGPGPNSPVFPGQTQGQPNYQQMAAQFSSDPATQQAYLREMFGGGQQLGNYGHQVFSGYDGNNPLPQVDFRAATFGGGSLFPANTGSGGSGAGGGTNTNIPNTTNPTNTQYTTPGFGGATNRRSSWGSGMSLFGNQFGGGQSPFYAGPGNNLPAYSGGGPSGSYTAPEYREYRGAGTYGRPASYGQSQRPY